MGKRIRSKATRKFRNRRKTKNTMKRRKTMKRRNTMKRRTNKKKTIRNRKYGGSPAELNRQKADIVYAPPDPPPPYTYDPLPGHETVEGSYDQYVLDRIEKIKGLSEEQEEAELNRRMGLSIAPSTSLQEAQRAILNNDIKEGKKFFYPGTPGTAAPWAHRVAGVNKSKIPKSG